MFDDEIYAALAVKRKTGRLNRQDFDDALEDIRAKRKAGEKDRAYVNDNSVVWFFIHIALLMCGILPGVISIALRSSFKSRRRREVEMDRNRPEVSVNITNSINLPSDD
jgi:hypothetical protein